MKKLTLIDKAFILKKTPLFESLDLDLLLPIADKLTLLHFDTGDNIFSINDDAKRMYFIAKGTVEILSQEKQMISILEEDDFFGDEAIFSEKPRAYHAFSKKDSTLLALSRTNLLTIISESPSVAISLLQIYASLIPFRKIISG